MRSLIVIVSLFLLLWGSCAVAQSKQKIILQVIVNDVPVGEFFFTLDANNALWANEKTLNNLRLQRQLWAEKQSNGLVLLKALAPQLSYQLDGNNAQLHLHVEPVWLKPQILKDDSRITADTVANTESYTAFLNYQIQSLFNDQQGFVGINLPYNLGLNLQQINLDSSFNFSYQNGQLKNNRLLTTVRYDDQEAMQTFTLGDITPRGQRLSSGTGVLGGISWRKNFQLNRYTHVSPELELRTALTTPTHARIFVNGALIKETDLLPGQVVFDQLPVSTAQGQAKLVLSDNTGREQIITEPFYLMYNQLKKGLHDYDYNIGFARRYLGEKDFVYDSSLSIQALHRYGLTNSTTLGLATIKQNGYTLINPQIQTTLGQYQQIELDSAFSQYGKQYGMAFEAHYRFQFDNFLFQSSGNWLSQDYTGFDRMGSALKSRLNATARYGTPELGIFTVSYNQSDGQDNAVSDKSVQFSYNKCLFDGVYLSVSVQHSISQDSTGAFLSFEYRPTLTKENTTPLFTNLRYIARYLPQNNQSIVQNELNISNSNYRYNYNAQLLQQQNKLMTNIRGQYRTDSHLYTAAFVRAEDNSQTAQLAVSGGMVALKEGVYFGRPVSDSFAVVKIENNNETTLVRANDMTVMETDKPTVLLPEFASYSRYQIGIQSQRFNNLKDIRYNLENAIQPLVITRRGGAFLDLKINRIFAVEGHIYYFKGDKKEYLSLLPLQFNLDGNAQESFTGEKGYFYLENLKVGQYVLTMIRKEGNCQVIITATKTAKSLLNVGDIECVK